MFDPFGFLDKKHLFAIVGASNNKSKNGFAVFERFLKKGFQVIPVVIEESLVLKVQGKACFPDLTSVRPFPDSVVIVDTKPLQTLKFLRQMRDLGISRVWLEKKTHNMEVVKFCREYNFSTTFGDEVGIVEFMDENLK